MSAKEGLGLFLFPSLRSIPLTFCLRCCRALQENEGLVAWLVPREPTVTQAVLENPVFLEPG